MLPSGPLPAVYPLENKPVALFTFRFHVQKKLGKEKSNFPHDRIFMKIIMKLQ